MLARLSYVVSEILMYNVSKRTNNSGGVETDHVAAAAAVLSLVSLHNTDYNPEI